MTSRADVLRMAVSKLGYVEQGGPDGHSGNLTMFWDWWDKLTGEHDQGASWCGCFVSWCFDQAGMRYTIGGKPGYIYCPTGEAWFKGQGRLTDALHARPGDVAFFHFSGEANVANHTGIVESVDLTHRTITCIEGNTSNSDHGSQSNGGGVYRKTRPWSVVRSIGQPVYTAASALVSPPPSPPTAPTEESFMLVCFRDPRTQQVFTTDGVTKRHIERPALTDLQKLGAVKGEPQDSTALADTYPTAS